MREDGYYQENLTQRHITHMETYVKNTLNPEKSFAYGVWPSLLLPDGSPTGT